MSETDSDQGPALHNRKLSKRTSIDSENNVSGEDSDRPVKVRRSSRIKSKPPVVVSSSESDSESDYSELKQRKTLSKRKRKPSKCSRAKRRSSGILPP